MAVVVLACFCNMADGLDPHRSYSQYLRQRWTMGNGFPGGRINSIAQTADGYLWIGTSKGLVRFDNFSFVSVGRSNRVTPPISQALALVSGTDGSLWVWDQTRNVQRYLHGKFDGMTSSSGEQRNVVAAVAPSNGDGVLVATQAPRVFRYRNGTSEALTGKGNLEIPVPQTLAATTDGRIWMATYEAGLFYFQAGRTTAVTEGVPDSKINCMLPVENGGLWIGTDKGLVLWDGREISTRISLRALKGSRVLSLARDREANLWIGTSGGLFRLNSAGLSLMEDGQQRSSRTVTAIFEDRENNLWVGDAEGIERLRNGLFTTYSVGEGLLAESLGPIYTDSSDRAWVAPSNGGLYRIANGEAVRVAAAGLGPDVIYSIAGFKEDLWVGRREGGLTHLVQLGGARPDVQAVKTYTHVQGLAQNSVSSVFRSSDGTIWAGTLSGGVSRLQAGKFATFTSSDGLGSNTISSIQEGGDGAMWFATSDGLTRLAKGVFNTYRARDGLPSDEVITILADSSGILWVGTSQGLAYFSLGAITPVVDTRPALHEPIFGVAEDAEGFLWVTSANHVFRVRRDALRNGLVDDEEYREYGEEDGLRGTEGVRRDRSAITDAQGRVWLSTSHGISMAGPTGLQGDAAPPIPQVESLSSDGNPASFDGPIRIGPDPQRISITYEAVSLAVPYRVRYRYRLHGFDRSLSDPTDVRQVVYTNLGPGSYRLELLASRNNGAWQRSEDAISFTIEPTIWETWWFRVACGLSIAGVLWLLYLYRLNLATARIQERLDARLEERERIARELHDTLLQGFQGLMLRLQAVSKILPPQEASHKMLEQVLDRADQVLLEGRERVKDLRQAQMTPDDLSEVIARCGEELAEGGTALFNVAVLGSPQALDPAVFSEVNRIAREALFNCFQHAKASKVEAEITYSHAAFSLRILDDGIGIDEALVSNGRVGHWGLAGMRERAQKVGGRLNIWTRPGTGTEIDLVIPAKLAFPRRRRPTLWDRLNRRRTRSN
jgi:ligand-binding sensor domain-containing protein